MTTFVALLRAVNVGGRKVPMADLRDLCTGLGFEDVRTYIASGNLVFTGEGDPAAIEATLEEAIEDRFGFPVDVMARTAAQWSTHLAANPFPAEAESEPNRLMINLPKSPPLNGAAEAITERGQAGERAAVAGDAVWIHYPVGVGTSKLTPTFVDKAIGSPSTARNWRTARKLQEMAEGDA